MSRFNDDQTDALLAKLREAKSPGVQTFAESVDKTNGLYSKPQRLPMDAEYAYLVPGWREEERQRNMQAIKRSQYGSRSENKAQI